MGSDLAIGDWDFTDRASEGDGEAERWYMSAIGVGPRGTSDATEADPVVNEATTVGGIGSGREP